MLVFVALAFNQNKEWTLGPDQNVYFLDLIHCALRVVDHYQVDHLCEFIHRCEEPTYSNWGLMGANTPNLRNPDSGFHARWDSFSLKDYTEQS